MYIFAFQTFEGFCISPFWVYAHIPKESLIVTEIEFTCCCAEISGNESPGLEFFPWITSLFVLISCYFTDICLSEFNLVNECHSVTICLSWLNGRGQHYIYTHICKKKYQAQFWNANGFFDNNFLQRKAKQHCRDIQVVK